MNTNKKVSDADHEHFYDDFNTAEGTTAFSPHFPSDHSFLYRQYYRVGLRLVNEIPPGLTRLADHLIVKEFFHLMDNAMKYHGKIPFIGFSADEQMRNKMAIT